MRILGLDPGSRVCGYGVVDCRAGVLRYVECGVLTAPGNRAMEERLGEIACGLRDVIGELRPTVVAVEDVFVQVNARSALALAQARGMALAVIGVAGLPVASYPPALVKKTVTGSGAATKEQIGRMVQALIGLKTVPRADAGDALAVAITHGRTLQPSAARIVPAVRRAPEPAVEPSETVPRRGSSASAASLRGSPRGSARRGEAQS
jgi:crossover junction endodeoxyribonuclease RuvC